MAVIQQAGLEQIQLNLRPAGVATTLPLANMIVLKNTDPAMPATVSDRDYSGANTGTFMAYVSSTPQVGGSTMEIPFTTLSYRDLTMLFEAYLQGGVVPVETPAASGLYLRTYSSQATSDDLARVGIQAGGDIGKLQAINMLGSNIVITGTATSGKLIAAASFLGDQPEDVASFEAPVAYDSGLPIVFGEDTAIYLDNTAANIGTTRIDCELVKQAVVTLNNAVTGTDTTCGKQYGRNKRYMEISLRLLLGQGAYDEVVNGLTNVKRYLQLYIPNDPVPASATGYWRLNVAGYWKPYDFGIDGAFRDVGLTIFSEFDETLGYDWECELYNDLATFPAYQP